MVYQIEAEIDKYEQDTGNNIAKIAVYRTNELQYTYSNLCLDYEDSNTYAHSMMHDSWSDVELINYITGSSYQEPGMNEEIFKEYFEGKEWDVYLPSEQYVFANDTPYWAIY